MRSQALFALAWFHAIVQERRMYIPQVGKLENVLDNSQSILFAFRFRNKE